MLQIIKLCCITLTSYTYIVSANTCYGQYGQKSMDSPNKIKKNFTFKE